MKRRNWLLRVLSGTLLWFASGAISFAHKLSPKTVDPIVYRFPGGIPIPWSEQKNGDLIVFLSHTKSGCLSGIDVWKVAAEGPVFTKTHPGGYQQLALEDMYALLPSWQPDKHVDSLKAFLELRTYMKSLEKDSPQSMWNELAMMMGRQKELSPEAKKFLEQQIAGTGWKFADKDSLK